MTTPITVAIVGAGGIAAVHLDAYLALGDQVRVAAIVASNPERGRALAARVPGAWTTDDVADVMNDPTIDAVDLCGYTREQVANGLLAASAGKHMLLEKPPALTLAEFDSLLNAVDGTGLVAMVGQTVRFQPAIETMLDALDADEIGVASLVHVTWYVAHVWPRAWRGWQLDPNQSGGHLIHNGMHSIDLALRLLGDEPTSVFTRGWKTYSPDLPTCDSFHVTMQCRNGGLAVLETSYALRPPAEPYRRVMVAGADGTLVHSTEHETELYNPMVPSPSGATDGAMIGEIRAWLQVVRGEIASPIPLGHSRVVLAAAIAAQESLESGRAVSLEPATSGGPQ